ncbi:E3 ubiquitin-protein ligase RING1 [Spatholobus suberectus]|nr:E3 ubiquitin-protein ligase RING1 [Spatholobus suberectus]
MPTSASLMRTVALVLSMSLEALFRELKSVKSGRPPALKESINAMPIMEIGERCEYLECVVCLEEFGVGGVAKDMYKMPVEEGDKGKKKQEEGGKTRRGGGGGEVWRVREDFVFWVRVLVFKLGKNEKYV